MREQHMQSQYYEVQCILNHRYRNCGVIEYLIRWRGWPISSATWEPLCNLENLDLMIKNYEQKLLKQKKIIKVKNRMLNGSTKSILKNQKEQKNQFKKINRSQDKIKNTIMKQIQELIVIDSENLSQNFQETVSKQNHQKQQNNSKMKWTQPQSKCIKQTEWGRQVNQILQIQVRQGQWKVQVQFMNKSLPNKWINRDIFRIMNPLKLLLFYEKLNAEGRKHESKQICCL